MNLNTKKISLVIYLICAGVLFVVGGHGDQNSIISYEVLFWKSLLENGVHGFYEYCYSNVNAVGVAIPVWDYIVYVVLGIWGLPIYIIGEVFNINVLNSIFCIVYGKSIYLVALYISFKYIKKICIYMELDQKQAELAGFSFISSSLLLIAVCLVGQCDILGIALTLVGLYYYLRENWWKMILFFAIAFGFKFYGLIIIIPLILLREKKILKIVGMLATIVVPTKIFNVLFAGLSAGGRSHFQLGMLSELLEYQLPLLNGHLSILVLCYGIICVVCYLYRCDNEKRWKQQALFVAMLSMVIWFACFPSVIYWLAWLCPWACLGIFCCAKYKKQSFVLEILGMVALSMANMVKSATAGYCLPGSGNMYILGNILKVDCNKAAETYLALIHKIDSLLEGRLEWILGAACAVYLACMIGILFDAYRNEKDQSEGENQTELMENIESKHVWYRAVLNMCIAYLPVFFLVFFG